MALASRYKTNVEVPKTSLEATELGDRIKLSCEGVPCASSDAMADGASTCPTETDPKDSSGAIAGTVSVKFRFEGVPCASADAIAEGAINGTTDAVPNASVVAIEDGAMSGMRDDVPNASALSMAVHVIV